MKNLITALFITILSISSFASEGVHINVNLPLKDKDIRKVVQDDIIDTYYIEEEGCEGGLVDDIWDVRIVEVWKNDNNSRDIFAMYVESSAKIIALWRSYLPLEHVCLTFLLKNDEGRWEAEQTECDSNEL